MRYHLSTRSLSFCTHVAPPMMALDLLAISISEQDYGHTEGQSRTKAEQRAKIAQGFSKTMASKHIIGLDPRWPAHSTGLDCTPWDGHDYVWDWEKCYVVAAAWRAAAVQLRTPVIWGGVWDRDMRLLGQTPADMKAAVVAYNARHPGRDFNDGPHFQLAA